MQNKIIKSTEIKAPITKVWRALTDYKEFGTWFMVELENPFQVGRVTSGVLKYPGYEGVAFTLVTVALEPTGYFSYRWPHDENVVLQEGEPMDQTTLVEFELEETPYGTKLTVTESGFEALPEEQRMTALRENSGGWEQQVKNIRVYAES